MKTKFLPFLSLVIFIFLLTSCSGIIRYRGLSPQINKENPNEGFKLSHHDVFKMSKFGANALSINPKNHKISLLVFTNATEEQGLLIGPTLLFIPLPVIPWIPGIYKAITGKSPDEVIPDKLEISVLVRGQAEKEGLQIDFSTLAVTTDPPSKTEGYWEERIWGGKDHYFFRPVSGLVEISSNESLFRYSIPSVPPEISSIKMDFKGVYISSGTLEIPTVLFERGVGYGFNPGIIG